MLAGGSEAPITPLGVAGFCVMRALSTRNDEPQKASRPFDALRDGFVVGEGAGIVILERLEHAQKRKATILAEIVGAGQTADAYHITAPAPGGEGAVRAMRLALDDAGLGPDAVDYVNAHGTSTPAGDVAETQAIKRAFGDYAYNISISSTKSMTGHLLGGAGALETAICVQVVNCGIIPPTINLENPDQHCDLDYVPLEARTQNVSVALTNSFGFGGHNVTLAIKRWEE